MSKILCVIDSGQNLEHASDGAPPNTNYTPAWTSLLSLSSFFRGKEGRKDNTLIVCD